MNGTMGGTIEQQVEHCRTMDGTMRTIAGTLENNGWNNKNDGNKGWNNEEQWEQCVEQQVEQWRTINGTMGTKGGTMRNKGNNGWNNRWNIAEQWMEQ